MKHNIERHIEDYNNRLTKVFNFISIFGKYKVIGSSHLKTVRYNSDYDLESHLNIKTKNVNETAISIYKHFKKIFIDCKKDPNLFITDLKLGSDKQGEPLRWSYGDMMKGFKMVDGSKMKFEDALQMKSTIKLDIIYLLNGVFNEISDNYYIKIGAITNYQDINRETIIKSVEEDYKEQVKEGNYYKALKRQFVINNLTGEDSTTLIKYFNSDAGIINKTRSDLDMLLILLEQKFRPVNMEDVKNNLQIIKQNASYAPEIDVSKVIDKICLLKDKKKIYYGIAKMSMSLASLLNDDAKRFFK